MAKTLIVAGGGAAGFFCAVNAARMASALQVIILEKSSKVLSKVRVSGGGRCNVTHDCESISEMSKCYPRGRSFVKKLFGNFSATDTVKWFEERGVQLKVEADGRMFPVSDTSKSVIACLMNEANKYGIKILLNAGITSLAKQDDRWHISLQDGRVLNGDFLFLATGGFPTAKQYDWLQPLGLQIILPKPSLFTFNSPSNPITKLMGISTIAAVKIPEAKLIESGPVLITHWGLSGPCVLKLSAFGAEWMHEKNYRFRAMINWLPETDETKLQQQMPSIRNAHSAQKIKNSNPFKLPQRLWEHLLEISGINPEHNWSVLPAKNQNLLVKNLCSFEMMVEGKTTFKEEFVTAGGVSTEEINAQTAECRKHSNLFFGGELLNVDGITGGYNFQHAWSSGFVAARAIAERCR